MERISYEVSQRIPSGAPSPLSGNHNLHISEIAKRLLGYHSALRVPPKLRVKNLAYCWVPLAYHEGARSGCVPSRPSLQFY